jgi:hypothetical protein
MMRRGKETVIREIRYFGARAQRPLPTEKSVGREWWVVGSDDAEAMRNCGCFAA